MGFVRLTFFVCDSLSLIKVQEDQELVSGLSQLLGEKDTKPNL